MLLAGIEFDNNYIKKWRSVNMADEVETKLEEAPKKSSKSKLFLIIIAFFVLALGAGGFFAFKKFGVSHKEEKTEAKKEEKKLNVEKTYLFALDPFVVNLAEHGRFLKMAIQLEFDDQKQEEIIKQKTPILRDAIITLVSSKSADSISGAEGKLQFKDEVLLRLNQIMGKDFFKNVYFTEFVMQ